MINRKQKEEVFNKELGFRLMRRRQALHISQATLGLELDVTAQQIQKYESGKSRLSPEKLSLCANVLGVPVGYFYGEVDAHSLESYNQNVVKMISDVNALPVEIRTGIQDLTKIIRKVLQNRCNDNNRPQ